MALDWLLLGTAGVQPACRCVNERTATPETSDTCMLLPLTSVGNAGPVGGDESCKVRTRLRKFMAN